MFQEYKNKLDTVCSLKLGEKSDFASELRYGLEEHLHKTNYYTNWVTMYPPVKANTFQLRYILYLCTCYFFFFFKWCITLNDFSCTVDLWNICKSMWGKFKKPESLKTCAHLKMTWESGTWESFITRCRMTEKWKGYIFIELNGTKRLMDNFYTVPLQQLQNLSLTLITKFRMILNSNQISASFKV